MNKINNLINFLFKNNFKKEAKLLLKLAAPIPHDDPVFPVKEMGGGSFNLGGYENGITKEELLSNLNLKRLFKENHDPSFIGKFRFYHFFQEGSMKLHDFVKKFSESENPREMSVIGTQGDPCSIFQRAPFQRQYALELEGEVTSAFYFDASSSLMSSVSNESLIKKLEDLGINLRDEEGNIAYFPKLTALHRGNLESFFYDQESYDEASGGRRSDYHEFFIKNSKITKILVRQDFDPKQVYKDLFYEDTLDQDISHLVDVCGYISIDNFEKNVVSSMQNFVIKPWFSTGNYYDIDFEEYYNALDRADSEEKRNEINSRLADGYRKNSENMKNETFLYVLSELDAGSFDELSVVDSFFSNFTKRSIDAMPDAINNLGFSLYEAFDKYRVTPIESSLKLIFETFFYILNKFIEEFSLNISKKLKTEYDPIKLSDLIYIFIYNLELVISDSMDNLFYNKSLKKYKSYYDQKKEELKNLIESKILSIVEENSELKKAFNDVAKDHIYFTNEFFFENYFRNLKEGRPQPEEPPKIRPSFEWLDIEHDMPTIDDYKKQFLV